MNKNTKFPQFFTPTLFHLSDSAKKPVEVKFTTEQISHDGGLLLLILDQPPLNHFVI